MLFALRRRSWNPDRPLTLPPGLQPVPADTYTVRTWSGGTHLYVLAPEGAPAQHRRGTAPAVGWKVDTGAWGGLAVGAGSTFAGGPYEITHHAPVAS
ncbi:bifunctional DNA primase/polymerase [Streptomyces aureus]|uniref:bifunctional DNA primase/polymerase n=1 Tax=Streptomyces aureus TaxID=193461 RepID=UPI00099B8E68|nr:bifunctional DNA primase/polymerase [Streptomyces aureus]